MEKTVALLEEGVLGVHEGQHLERGTKARSEQALEQREVSLSFIFRLKSPSRHSSNTFLS